MSRFDSMSEQYNASPLQWVHGEDVTYAENGVSGTTIKAIVYRRPLEPQALDRSSRVEYGFEVFVSHADADNPVIGTSSITLNKTRESTSTHVRKVKARRQVSGGWLLTL